MLYHTRNNVFIATFQKRRNEKKGKEKKIRRKEEKGEERMRRKECPIEAIRKGILNAFDFSEKSVRFLGNFLDLARTKTLGFLTKFVRY